MATEKKFKATIEIGGAVAGSLKSSFAAVTGNTKILGASLSKLSSQQKKLKSFNSAQLRIGETQKKLMQAMKAGDTSGVERLRKSLDTQRQSLAKLGEELKKAKINTNDLSGEMERLGRKADATRKVMDSWGKIKPIGDNFQTVLKRTAGGFVAIGAAAAAASAGVWKMGTAFGNFADSAAEGAATLGTDANFLLSVRYAASQVGASAEMADKALSELNIRMVEAGEDGNKTGEALSELGLNIGKLQKMDTASQFATISQAFSKYTGSVNKAKIATDIFGKAGRKIPNLLNLGKEGLQGYAQAAQDAGYLLSDSDMLMGDAFDEAMGQFNLALQGSQNIIGRELLPVLTELMTSLGSFIRENAPNIKAVAQEFGGWLKTNGPIIGTQIRDMAKSLVEMGKAAWPFIESVGGVKAVLIGIGTIAFAPAIAAVASLGASFITAVPAVIKLTTGLWGMAAGATGIIPAIGGAATALWGMATAGWAAIAPLLPALAIGAAIIGGLTLLALGIKNVVENWDSYSAKLYEVWDVAKAFSGGIYDSISGAFDRLTGKIGAWFGWVREKFVGLGSSIKGVFTGGDSPAPIDGARAAGGPVSAGKNYLVGERGPEIFSPSSSGSIIPNHRAGGSVSNDNRTITINITASPGMNERTLADLVLARLDGRQAAIAGGALYD
jgi:hypothetical protein